MDSLTRETPIPQATHSPPTMAELEPEWRLPGALSRDVHEAYHEARRRAFEIKHADVPAEEVVWWLT